MRFGIKSQLIAVAVIALWLSTVANYPGSLGVYTLLAATCFVSSGFAAIYSRGRRRAFWASFFVVFLLLSCDLTRTYFPVFSPNPQELALEIAQIFGDRYSTFAYRTLWLVWIVLPATLTGTVVATIYGKRVEGGPPHEAAP
jgi:hypothetical protein